jgi:hypothetical protein
MRRYSHAPIECGRERSLRACFRVSPTYVDEHVKHVDIQSVNAQFPKPTVHSFSFEYKFPATQSRSELHFDLPVDELYFDQLGWRAQ